MPDRRRLPPLLASAVCLLLVGCLEPVGPPGASVATNDGTGEVFITDRTGKAWEISHAVANYGFVPADFQCGLGPEAIPPVFDPPLIGPGDAGYPAPDSPIAVVGASLADDPRAYPIGALRRHEIVNENFPDAPIAVAY